MPEHWPSAIATNGWLGTVMAIPRKPSAAEPDEPTGPSERADATKVPDVQPTEQIRVEPSPVAARSAVNRGKTGLGDLTADGARTTGDGSAAALASAQPTPRRHLLSSDITVAVLLVVVVSALTAWGVGTAVAASVVGSNSARLAPAATSTPVPQSNATTDGIRDVFHGTIESMDAAGATTGGQASWTILTRSARTLVIDIPDSTRFGTTDVAESAATFAVGDSVVVVATASAGEFTATRVAEANAVGSGTTTPTAPIPTPTSTATS